MWGGPGVGPGLHHLQHVLTLGSHPVQRTGVVGVVRARRRPLGDEPGALETHPDNESLKRDMAKRAREMYRKLPGREPGAREEIQ